jgi:hypothetical protein
MNDNKKVVCHDWNCQWHGLLRDALKANHPFIEAEIIYGCPDCKQTETIYEACDEPGCWKESSCGTPTENGYRRTCGKHCPK